MFSGLPGGKSLFSLPGIRQKVRWTFLVILYTKGADSDSFCGGDGMQRRFCGSGKNDHVMRL